MNSNKIILFPTYFPSESLNALDFTIDYAKKSDSTITLINIVEYPWSFMDSVSNSITRGTTDEKIIKESKISILSIPLKILAIANHPFQSEYPSR